MIFIQKIFFEKKNLRKEVNFLYKILQVLLVISKVRMQ